MKCKITKKLAQHYIVELIDCNPEKIKFVNDVKKIFHHSAEISNAVIIDEIYHQFTPFGVTGIILIAESHFSIHTWPEHKYAGFDIFTCGQMSPELAIEELKNNFEAKKLQIKTFPRGF